MSSAITILFASRTLDLSPGAIGLAFGVGSLGGVLGAVVAPAIARRIGLGASAMVGSVMFPLPIALIAFADGPTWVEIAVVAGAIFLGAFGVMLYDINLMSIETAVTADEIRSRVAGAFSTVNFGIRPVGALVGGVLGSLIGLRPTLLIAAVGGCLSLLPVLFSPIAKVRDVDELQQVALRP
jgi:MFS family permease